ncbi:MAG: DUF6356 family protein [Alphaproteobacteria bacterium]|nr:DUF6356 family protein [Alphaproteobacteria bacterium]
MSNPFTAHPTAIGESYGQHLRYASGFGWQMIKGGLACLIHGLFPFWFETTGSTTIHRLHARLHCTAARAARTQAQDEAEKQSAIAA